MSCSAVQWLYNEGRMGKRGCDEMYTLSCTIKSVKRVFAEHLKGMLNFKLYSKLNYVSLFNTKCSIHLFRP